MRSRRHRHAGWALAALLALAGCTYPEPPRGAIDLSVEDDVVTALLDHSDEGVELYESHDLGSTWTLVAQADHRSQLADYEMERESTACLDDGRCFRIDSESDTAVWEVSPTGDESPAWSFPSGRLDFLERYKFDGSAGSYNPTPRDIVVVDGVVLAAMGNDGVLRGAADGEWQRGVLGEPRPFSEWGANLYLEVVLGVMAASLLMAVVMLSTFAAWARRGGVGLWKSLGPWTVLGYVTTMPALFLVLILSAIGFSAGILLFLLPTFGAAIATWLAMFPSAEDRVGRWPSILLLAVPTGGASALGVFFLWSGGVVPWYPLALTLALVLAVAGTTLAVVAAVRSLPSQPAASRLPSRISVPASVSSVGVMIPWAGASIVATGTLVGALVFLLPIYLGIEEGPNGPLTRFLIATLVMGVALTVAGVRYRSHQGVRYGLAGLGASLLAGPGIGTMMAVPPTRPANTLLRITTYLLFWVCGVGVMFAIGMLGAVPAAVTFTFSALVTLSPFCVPLADRWALHLERHRTATT